MRILITLLLVVFPLRAWAQADCTVVDALERVQFAQMRLAQTSAIDPFSTDSQLIIAEVGRLDGTKVALTAATTLTPLDASRIMGFFNHSQTLRLTLLATHTDQSENLLSSPSFEQHMVHLKRILPLFRCNTLTNTIGADGLHKTSSTLGNTKPAQKLTFLNAGIIGLLAICAVIAALKIRSKLVTRKAQNKRASKRYRVHIVTKIKNRGLTQSGTVLDISCTGVKIQTTLYKANRIGDNIEIWIDQKWKTARITWSNQHYLGVQFDQALDHDYVMLLNASEQKTIRKNKNGARLGAAFDSQR